MRGKLIIEKIIKMSTLMLLSLEIISNVEASERVPGQNQLYGEIVTEMSRIPMVQQLLAAPKTDPCVTNEQYFTSNVLGELRSRMFRALAARNKEEALRFIKDPMGIVVKCVTRENVQRLYARASSQDEPQKTVSLAVIQQLEEIGKLRQLANSSESPVCAAISFRYFDLMRKIAEGRDYMRELAGSLKAVSVIGNLDLVRYFVEEKNAGRYEHEIYEALEAAAAHGHLVIVQYLIEKGASDQAKREAMIAAAENGRLVVVQYLVESAFAGSDTAQRKALAGAAENGHLAVVQFLAENTSAGDANRDALEGAARNGRLDVVQYLMRGASEGEKSDALYSAVKGNRLNIIEYVIRQGISADAKDQAFKRMAAGTDLNAVRRMIALGISEEAKRAAYESARARSEPLSHRTEGLLFLPPAYERLLDIKKIADFLETQIEQH